MNWEWNLSIELQGVHSNQRAMIRETKSNISNNNKQHKGMFANPDNHASELLFRRIFFSVVRLQSRSRRILEKDANKGASVSSLLDEGEVHVGHTLRTLRFGLFDIDMDIQYIHIATVHLRKSDALPTPSMGLQKCGDLSI